MSKSRQTNYDRMKPPVRDYVRRRALLVTCPYCMAPAGDPCRGINATPAKPHAARIAKTGVRKNQAHEQIARRICRKFYGGPSTLSLHEMIVRELGRAKK